MPFLAAGYNYAGVDISCSMLQVLLKKLGPSTSAQLSIAHVKNLPFKDASFNVVLAVQMLHLIPDWREMLHEAGRVLDKRNGCLILAEDVAYRESPQELRTDPSPPQQVREAWRDILESLGEQLTIIPGMRIQNLCVTEHLMEMGAVTDMLNLTHLERPFISARMVLQSYKDRIHSADWRRSPAIHAEAVRRLEAWFQRECPMPDGLYSIRGQFKVLIARWRAQ